MTRVKTMTKLDEMRERLNRITDIELLEVAKDVLAEMADINNLRIQLEMREAALSEGKRAAFYFFAQELESEQLSHATNTATGRIRFLKEKAERENYGKPKSEEASQEKAAEVDETDSMGSTL